MKRLALLFVALGLLGASQPPIPMQNGGNGTPYGSPPSVFFAQAFGSCVWDSAHDVGPCIQAAINQAGATTGGGKVILPNGTYGLATPLMITTQTTSVASSGYGILPRSNVAVNAPTSPTILNWIGSPVSAPSPSIYMMTVAAPLSPGKLLVGSNVEGILFDCKTVQGCSGMLVASLRYAHIAVGNKDSYGIPYVGGVVTGGSQAIQVSATTGLIIGQAVVGANIPDGAYVASITDGTHFNASAKASGSATETVTIGGEGIRFDVVDNLTDGEDNQFLTVEYSGMNLGNTVGAAPPLMMIGGSSITGTSGGHIHGNTSLNTFNLINCITNNSDCLVLNNSDHNLFNTVNIQNIGAGPAVTIVSNGSLDPNNGPARLARFGMVSGQGALEFIGTNTGGFTAASVQNFIYYGNTSSGVSAPIVGTGASVCFTSDAGISTGCTTVAAGTATDHSGAIALGGTAQNVLPVNAARLGCTLQMLGLGDLWFSLTTTAAANGSGSYNLPAGSIYTCPYPAPTGAISIFSNSTGVKFTATETAP